MVWSSAAAVAVSLVFYLLGFWISEEGLRRFVARYGRFVFLDESDLDKASEVFERHGGKAILIGHLVPGIGAFISIPAGMRRMSILGRFMFYTIVGCVLWNGVHVGLGWTLGSHWTLVERYAAIIEYSVLAVAVAGITWFVLRRWRGRR
jgi:membrane protein DedA with SNARE-associated domain